MVWWLLSAGTRRCWVNPAALNPVQVSKQACWGSFRRKSTQPCWLCCVNMQTANGFLQLRGYWSGQRRRGATIKINTAQSWSCISKWRWGVSQNWDLRFEVKAQRDCTSGWWSKPMDLPQGDRSGDVFRSCLNSQNSPRDQDDDTYEKKRPEPKFMPISWFYHFSLTKRTIINLEPAYSP